MKPVCLVLGAGAGIGGTVAAKFASEGYHSYLCRRTDQEGLDKLIKEITEEAKFVVKDYKDNPSQISGSVTEVHINSPELDEKKLDSNT